MDHYFDAMAPVFASFIFFSIPLALILTKHQQKMAQILRGESQVREQQNLERQVQDLTFLVSQQSMAFDNLSKAIARIENQTSSELPDRLSGEKVRS